MTERSNQDFEGLTTPPLSSQDVNQIRPWVRFWARMIDFILFNCCYLLIFGFLYKYFSADLNAVLLGGAFFLGYCAIEAAFLSSWGATPGKIFLRISVRTSSGTLLSYSSAFFRTLKVWALGMGLGLFPVSLFAYAISYNILTKKGVAVWDASGGFRVHHSKIGVVRSLCGLLLIFSLPIAFIAVSVYFRP